MTGFSSFLACFRGFLPIVGEVSGTTTALPAAGRLTGLTGLASARSLAAFLAGFRGFFPVICEVAGFITSAVSHLCIPLIVGYERQGSYSSEDRGIRKFE